MSDTLLILAIILSCASLSISVSVFVRLAITRKTFKEEDLDS